MRFSLQTLAFLVLLTALGVSGWTKLRSAVAKRLEAESIRQSLHDKQNAVREADQLLAWSRSNQQMETSIERHQDLTQRLATVFASEVEKLRIVPDPGKFSIRRIPTVRTPGDFEICWGLFVPENRSIAVAVEFEDASPRDPDFANQENTRADLTAGHHQIKARFFSSPDPTGTEGSALPRRRIFLLKLDGNTMTRNQSTYDESSSHSHSAPEFREQSDYGPDQSLPDHLLWLRPTPGDCAIRVKLIEVGDDVPN